MGPLLRSCTVLLKLTDASLLPTVSLIAHISSPRIITSLSASPVVDPVARSLRRTRLSLSRRVNQHKMTWGSYGGGSWGGAAGVGRCALSGNTKLHAHLLGSQVVDRGDLTP